MATLGIHRDFLWEFATLEKPVQKRVHEVFEKFAAATHAGLHLEKLAQQRDPKLRTIRIDKFWRGVVAREESGDSYLLLKVLPHDKAIAWAAKHRVTINAATHGIEIRNDVALEEATARLQAGASQASAPASPVLFPESAYSDEVLRDLGLDGEILPLIRLLPDDSYLGALHRALPEQQYDVLVGLAAGMTAEEVKRELVQVYARTAAPTPDASPDDVLAGAMARSRGRVALVTGPAALMEVLERPFDTWRVFLHPSQWRVAYTSFAGPARVTGGPGTGKTVVALHRAGELARLLPADAPDGSVLLTTFTKDLAFELDRCLTLLVPDQSVRAKVRVVHVDALANEIVRTHRGGAPLKIAVDHKALLGRWERIAAAQELDLTPVFLDQEWRQVVLAQAIGSVDEYLKADRAGRGHALPPLKRVQVWRAVESFERELRDAGEMTFLQVCAAAATALDAQADRRFRHVVVDEAQDLHHAHWRFLRALVAPDVDDLFIAGDTFQRIYGNKVSMRSLGIGIVGRSFRLRINYRTTHEILTWASGLLTGEPTDDMDDGAATLSGYHSTMRGARPVCSGASSKAEEFDGLVQAVGEWLAAGVEPQDIAVAVRFRNFGQEVADELHRAGIPAVVLGGGATPAGGVRIGTMHRMKGLEFRCVAVAGIAAGMLPLRGAVTAREDDPNQHEEDLRTELNLLFVAATRAREALRVSWHGAPSPFLSAAGVAAAV
jgi:superfamily I DNA/RNA helicase